MRLMPQPLTVLINRVFRESFWAWPAVGITLNFALALGLCAIVIQPDDYDHLRPDKRGGAVFFFAGTEDGARAVVALVASAAISVVTLTFSLTVLSLQLAAANYTPRLIDEFLKDPVQKLTLSVFLGTYAYCFIVMLNIQGDGDSAAAPSTKYVPLVAVNALILHVVVMLGTFVVFIHHFVHNMRLERVLHRAQASALSVLRRYPQLGEDSARPKVSALPDAAFRIYASRSGYVRTWNLAVLEDAARELDVVFRFNVYIGQFVTQGSLLCYVWSEGYGRPQDGERLSESKDGSGGEEERADGPAERGEEGADERKHGTRSGVLPADEDGTRDADDDLVDSGRRERSSSRGAARASEGEGPAHSRADNKDGGGGAGRDGERDASEAASRGASPPGGSGHGTTTASSNRGRGRDRSSSGNDADRSGSPAAEHGGDGASCHAGVQGLPEGQARVNPALGGASHGEHSDHGGHGIDENHHHNEDGNARRTSRRTQQLMRAAQRSVKRYGRERLTELVHSALELSGLRKDDNDASLGMQQLTDVAVRALSSGVNDPQTAVQVMDSLCTVFFEVCSRDLPDEIVVFTKRPATNRGSAERSAQRGSGSDGRAGCRLFRRGRGENDGGAGCRLFRRGGSGGGGGVDGSGSGDDSEEDDDPLVGRPYAVAPGLSFAFFLSMCMNPIRAYGAGDVGVARRALEMLEDLAVLCRTEERQQRVRERGEN